MIRNYLTLAWRQLRKHRGYAALNITGLAVGMAACLLVFIFVQNEVQFDGFHPETDRLYRLNEIQRFPGTATQHVALSMYPMGPALQEDYPEVEAFTRFIPGPSVLRQEEQQILLDKSFYTDPSIFDLFGFQLAQGDPATALDAPQQMLLTETTAERLFGHTDVLGQQVLVENTAYTVSGVLEDVPENSHLQFEALLSVATIDTERNRNRWGNNWLVTYVRLQPGTHVPSLEAKFPDFLTRHMSEEANEYYSMYLQPFRDVHLGSMGITHDYQNAQKFDGRYVWMFVLLGSFVLLIAGINFMNLATARSATRAKEVGVRKALGARKQQLRQQFLGESVLLAVVAFGVAVVLALISLPALNALSGRTLSLGFLLHLPTLAMILGVVVLFGLGAGLYPAFFLTRFEPALVLKGGQGLKGRRTPLRNLLVVAQFAIAIVLIIGTTLAFQQFQFMRNWDAGFDRSQVVLVPMSGDANEAYATLKQELQSLPQVEAVTASGQRLGNNLHQWGVRAQAPGEEPRRLTPSNLIVDYNFIDFYGIELLAGRAFSEERGTDQQYAFIINEALVKELGWEDETPVGYRMGMHDSLGTVIGVAKDFNFNSLHHAVNPLTLSVQTWGFAELSIRVPGSQVEAALPQIEAIWDQHITDRPFDYTFLDDHFAELYRADQQMAQVIGLLAGLAILIACLGLFGLAAVVTQQRTKEIGVRKALGATVPQILGLLSKDFAKLVGVAFVLAAPIAYFAVSEWLGGYAFRIDIGVGVFVFAGLAALGIALGTISYRAFRAARTNPVEALRYE